MEIYSRIFSNNGFFQTQIFSLLLQKLSSRPGQPKMRSHLAQCLRKFPQPISSSSSHSSTGADMSVSSSNRKSLKEKIKYSSRSENPAAYLTASLHAGLGHNDDNWYSWYTGLVMEQIGLYPVSPRKLPLSCPSLQKFLLSIWTR